MASMIGDKLLIELDYYPLKMAARKTGLTEDDLIFLAAQDKLNVCVLMPQNKSVTRFPADPDLYEKELPCCFSSLCKVPALTFKNYLADNSTLLDIVKSCEEDGVYYRLTDDAPLKDMKLVVMADDIKRLTASNAPKPITPLTGSRYLHKPPVIPPADYETWRKADLWTIERGILLLLNAEGMPSPNTSTGRCNSDDEQRLYDDCMKIWAIAESSLIAGTLKRIGKSYPHFASQILPSVFIDWARSKGYQIPDELSSGCLLPQIEPVTNVGTGSQNQESKPWLIPNSNDPKAEQPWYISARYFARELVIEDSTLIHKRRLLSVKVAKSLDDVGIKKRGNKVFSPATILKAFNNINFG
jgi:hypothetical protein